MAKAGLAFASEPITYDRRDLDEQRQILVDRFAGAGWQCDALLAAAQEADDFYFDSFVQVLMPAWTSGRVALVGDAGYCASPLSGMGTSLALVGTYLLAGELGSADSFDAQRIQGALQRYQTKMRPYVDKCQDIPNRVDRFAPSSASDIAMNIGVMKWMRRWPFRPIAAKLWLTAADSIELPNYSTVWPTCSATAPCRTAVTAPSVPARRCRPTCRSEMIRRSSRCRSPTSRGCA